MAKPVNPLFDLLSYLGNRQSMFGTFAWSRVNFAVSAGLRFLGWQVVEARSVWFGHQLTLPDPAQSEVRSVE
jgi:hypothetical protein